MKIKFLILLFIGCNFLYVQANISRTDSLKKFTYQELEKKFYSYKSNCNIKESKLIAQYFLQKARSEKKKNQIEEGYVMMHFNESLPVSLKYIDSLQSITRDSKENYYPARIFLLKGNLYFKFYNMQAALNNYMLGLKYAKEKGNKRQIAIADISIAYLNNYIGKHAETINTLKYYMDNADYVNANERDNLKLNLADAYIEINRTDSAYVLLQQGLQSSIKNNDDYRYYQNLSLLGFLDLKRKRYKAAINNLLKCEKYFFSIDDERNQNYTLLNLGKSYAGIKNEQKAIHNFIKIDSIVQKSNYMFPELREVYTYLIDYYREKNKEKQLYYVERFLKIDQKLDLQFRYISREIPRRYDKPKLLKEKEDITNELNNKKIFFYSSLAILLLILSLFVFLYFKSKKAEKQYRKIAQDLIRTANENKIKKNIEKTNEIISDYSQELIVDNKIVKTISENITQMILAELKIFEDKEQFLNKGITLGSLAKKIKTNSKYLSETINTCKGKNFTAYLNDLRIDYAINRLAEDKKFRSYKISSIADELGYNTEQSFTMAFKKRTGTPLSIYLKELERIINKSNHQFKTDLVYS